MTDPTLEQETLQAFAVVEEVSDQVVRFGVGAPAATEGRRRVGVQREPRFCRRFGYCRRKPCHVHHERQPHGGYRHRHHLGGDGREAHIDPCESTGLSVVRGQGGCRSRRRDRRGGGAFQRLCAARERGDHARCRCRAQRRRILRSRHRRAAGVGAESEYEHGTLRAETYAALLQHDAGAIVAIELAA